MKKNQKGEKRLGKNQRGEKRRGENQKSEKRLGENQTQKPSAKKRRFKIAMITLAIWLLSSGALQLGPERTSSGPSQPQVWANSISNYGFKDLTTSHWAWSEIETMSKRGIIKGYPDQSFKPEKPVTYGEYIKMATVILDGHDVGNGNYIDNVNDTQKGLDQQNGAGENWAAEYYRKGMENSFYTEYEIPKAKLNWPITRGDMALIINGLLGTETVKNYDQVARTITDVNSKTKHEYEIVKAYAIGILKGYPDGSFRPEGTLSRAEAATSLHRIIEKKIDQNDPNADSDANVGSDTNAASITDLVENMGEYSKQDWMEGWAKSWGDSENYKMVSPQDVGLKIRVPWNGRLTGFDHTMVGFIYLIKDGQIVEYCRSIPAETFVTSGSHYQLDAIDYIMCIPSKNGNQETILLVKNPFRRQV